MSVEAEGVLIFVSWTCWYAALQKHYTMLENLALGYEEALENALDVDGTLPDVEGMQVSIPSLYA